MPHSDVLLGEHMCVSFIHPEDEEETTTLRWIKGDKNLEAFGDAGIPYDWLQLEVTNEIAAWVAGERQEWAMKQLLGADELQVHVTIFLEQAIMLRDLLNDFIKHGRHKGRPKL